MEVVETKETKQDERLTRIKANIAEVMRKDLTLNMHGVAKHFGISRTTLWRLKTSDAELSGTIDQLLAERDEDRGECVESKFIQRLMSGEASEAGYIFYLCNKFPDKYKNQKVMINNNPSFNNNPTLIGNLSQTFSVLESSSDAELEDIIARSRTPSKN